MERALLEEDLGAIRIKVGHCPASRNYSLTRYTIRAEKYGKFVADTSGPGGRLEVSIGV